MTYFSKRGLKKILENPLSGFIPLVIVNNDLTFFGCSNGVNYMSLEVVSKLQVIFNYKCFLGNGFLYMKLYFVPK